MNAKNVVFLAFAVGLISSSSLPALPKSDISEKGKFARLCDEFMSESLARSPSTASQVGYHVHRDKTTKKKIELDSMLDDMSEPFMLSQKKFFEHWRQRFIQEAPASTLNPEELADLQLINDQIALNLLEYDEIKNYAHNPTVAVELIGSALFQPLTSTYAPKAKRMEHIIARIQQVPRLLQQVQGYMDKADPVYVKTAIEENEGNVELIEKTIAKELADDSKTRAKFDKVAPAAIAALKEYTSWLESDLSKRTEAASWRLGKDLYEKKFKLVMESDISATQLLANAESALVKVRKEMLEIAEPMHKALYNDHGDHNDKSGKDRENLIISEVLRKVSDDRPKRDELIKTVENDLDGIKRFIRDKKIVSLSDRDNLKVVPTPVFLRGVYSVAGFHSAPALNPKAEAQYWVTPIDPGMSDQKAESKLREYNNYTLKWLTIHEALPGHYIQFEHLNNIEPKWRRLLRSLYSNGAYVEGWAEYIAQVMMDEGFMKGDDRVKLTMRKIRLRLLANTILDIRMHTMNMSDEEAMALMTTDAFQTQAEAEGKLKRAKLSSTQLPTYYAGLVEWLALRDKYQAAKGKNFDLLDFHNRVLDEGPLPVAAVGKLIMKE